MDSVASDIQVSHIQHTWYERNKDKFKWVIELDKLERYQGQVEMFQQIQNRNNDSIVNPADACKCQGQYCERYL